MDLSELYYVIDDSKIFFTQKNNNYIIIGTPLKCKTPIGYLNIHVCYTKEMEHIFKNAKPPNLKTSFFT
jgi:hypothetical protein